MVENAMRDMARRMKSKPLGETLHYVSDSMDGGMETTLAILVCRKDPKSHYYDMAVAMYDLSLTMGAQLEDVGDLIFKMLGLRRKVKVKFSHSELLLLTDTYVPHRLLQQLYRVGAIKQIRYCP